MKILKEFMQDEDGMGVVEIILIIVVLIGLVVIFKDSIITVVQNIMDNITEKTDEVLAD